MSDTSQWFGQFNLEPHHTRTWRVGPLSFWVNRAYHEWRLRVETGGDPYSPSVELDLFEERQADVEDRKVQRFLVSDESRRLDIGLLLPDRPIVSSPASPVSIPGGESVRFYLSYPLWVSLSAGDPGRTLTEFASYRLSDTWFGPNTREGMLCYATRGRCRLNVSDHPYLPYRAITPLVISNRAKDALPLDRVKLPVSSLSLYRSRGPGWLWTQDVTLLRQEGGDMAELQLGRGAPEEADAADLVAGARELSPRNAMVRAFSALF